MFGWITEWESGGEREGGRSELESDRVVEPGPVLEKKPCKPLQESEALQAINCTTLGDPVKFFRPQLARVNNEGR